MELSREMKALGADLIDVSSGGNIETAAMPAGPGYQTTFAERIRREAGIATSTVGMITSAAQADHVVLTGQADLRAAGARAAAQSLLAPARRPGAWLSYGLARAIPPRRPGRQHGAHARARNRLITSGSLTGVIPEMPRRYPGLLRTPAPAG